MIYPINPHFLISYYYKQMACQWYNPELPNSVYSNNGNQCDSCNGTQYNVTIHNATKFPLAFVNISGIPIEVIGDDDISADSSPLLPVGQTGILVTNDTSGLTLVNDLPLPPQPTSPMLISFTDIGSSNPCTINIKLVKYCSGKANQTVNGVTYTIHWTLNCHQGPFLNFTITRNPTG